MSWKDRKYFYSMLLSLKMDGYDVFRREALCIRGGYHPMTYLTIRDDLLFVALG